MRSGTLVLHELGGAAGVVAGGAGCWASDGVPAMSTIAAADPLIALPDLTSIGSSLELDLDHPGLAAPDLDLGAAAPVARFGFDLVMSGG